MKSDRSIEQTNRNDSLLEMIVFEFDLTQIGYVCAHTDKDITILQSQIFFGLISKIITICKSRIERIEWAKETIFLKQNEDKYLLGSYGLTGDLVIV